MKSVLLTGFEPFGDSHINPSIEACRPLDNKNFNSLKVSVREIPLIYNKIRPTLINAIEEIDPFVIICTGQSSSSSINLERIAINIADAKIPYNCGTQPIDQVIVHEGPAGYFSTLPLRKIFEALKRSKIPANLSNSAGTFGCNHIFYELMHYISRNNLDMPAGFIHVPSLPEQVIGKNQPSMDLRLIIKAFNVVIDTISKDL